jgi:hypothetical protein
MNDKFAISNEDLNFAAERGILDVGQVQEQIEDMRRKELLSQHPYKIWQGKDGVYYTYLAYSCRNRKLVHRTSLEKLQDKFAISNEDLNFAAERGILDVGQVQEQETCPPDITGKIAGCYRRALPSANRESFDSGTFS